jgi:hypothetical protein
MIKLTFKHILKKHQVSMTEVSRYSGISTLLIWMMVLGQPVQREDAERALAGLNRLCGTTYRLETLNMPLSEAEEA